MKISQLIAQLKRIQKEDGDLPVIIRAEHHGFRDARSPYTLQVHDGGRGLEIGVGSVGNGRYIDTVSAPGEPTSPAVVIPR